VTSIIRMSTGFVEISSEHDRKITRTDRVPIASASDILPYNLPHRFTLATLDSFFTLAAMRLRQVMSDPNWAFQIKGTSIGGGSPKILPRRILVVKSTVRNAATAQVDWSRSIVRLSDDDVWYDVKISFGLKSGLTAKQSRERRITAAVQGLLAMIKADPRRSQSKAECKDKLGVSIDGLRDREFDRAWKTACADARRENPGSRWGLPGRPVR